MTNNFTIAVSDVRICTSVQKMWFFCQNHFKILLKPHFLHIFKQLAIILHITKNNCCCYTFYSQETFSGQFHKQQLRLTLGCSDKQRSVLLTLLTDVNQLQNNYKLGKYQHYYHLYPWFQIEFHVLSSGNSIYCFLRHLLLINHIICTKLDFSRISFTSV